MRRDHAFWMLALSPLVLLCATAAIATFMSPAVGIVLACVVGALLVGFLVWFALLRVDR